MEYAPLNKNTGKMKQNLDEELEGLVKKTVGKKVVIIGDHPRADEVGIIIGFNPSVGITGKPAFEVEPANSSLGNFFVFNGRNVKFL